MIRLPNAKTLHDFFPANTVYNSFSVTFLQQASMNMSSSSVIVFDNTVTLPDSHRQGGR
jgi:hypothetical protein